MDISQHYIRYCSDRKGWCIFIDHGRVVGRLVAGPFQSEDSACTECDRLNGID